MNEVLCESGKRFQKVTKWLKIRQSYDITPRHKLYDYCTDGNGYRPTEDNFDASSGIFLDYISFKNEYGYNTRIPTTEIYRLESMFLSCKNEYFTEKGEKHCISCVDMYTNIYDPYYFEIDEYGEKARVFRLVKGV